VSDLETGKNLDNSARQPLAGWKLWWRFFRRGYVFGAGHYQDSAFPACPACGSPNVVLTPRYGISSALYKCLELDCNNQGRCEVEGSDGVERRKARVRQKAVTGLYVAVMIALLLYMVLTGQTGQP
jgi:hypothetical protein